MKSNYVRIRGDRIGIELKKTSLESKSENTGEEAITFELIGNKSASWLDNSLDGNKISIFDLRRGIEPWLASLFQSEHLSLLTGSGLSYAVQGIAGIPLSNAMSIPELNSAYLNSINDAAVESAKKSGHGNYPNVEDFIRVINELLQGLKILGHDRANTDTCERKNFEELNIELEKMLTSFTTAISKIEHSLACCPNDEGRKNAFNYLVNFLMSFASRIGTRDRLNIFTTNYDRVIEAGAELAGLRLIDRFVGTLAPIFSSSRLDIDMHYNPPGIRGEPRYLEGVARFTKLHGSIDWIEINNEIRRVGLPFGSENTKLYLKVPGLSNNSIKNMIIYPNSSKDRETAEYPFVELFRDFATTLCKPNSTLVTYGYGFGDEHINRILRDMLSIPSTHLIVIAFEDTENRIENFINKVDRHSQISVIVGESIASLKTLVDYFLPKASIDKASIRMGELIRQRYVDVINDKSVNTIKEDE